MAQAANDGYWRGCMVTRMAQKPIEKTAVYPGTFDPVTLGHIDLLERALKLFGSVVVGVATNPNKKPLFSLSERISLLKDCTKGMGRVEIKPFSGLLVDFAKSQNSRIIIRGLREVSDFHYEFQSATVNRKLAPEIETVFIMTGARYFYLNSSLVKEIAALGGCIEQLVPKPVEAALMKKFRKKRQPIA